MDGMDGKDTLDFLYEGKFKQLKELHEKEVDEYLKELVPIVDIVKTVDQQKYQDNLRLICHKWIGRYLTPSDRPEKRLIHEVVQKQKNNPLAIALISDHVATFEKYENTKEYIHPGVDYWLEAACLVGAKMIVEHLWNTAKDVNIQTLLQYSLASGNHELALEVANFLKMSGKSCPKLHSYFFKDRPVIQKIQQILLAHQVVVPVSGFGLNSDHS